MEERNDITRLNQGGAQAPQAAEQERPEDKPLTAADVERIVEQLLSKRLARLQMAASGRLAQARSEGRAEGERLSGMDEGERRRYEAEAAQAREEELRRREQELDRRELRAWVAEELVQRGLPKELADAIDCADAARCAECVDALDRCFRASVQRSVDERLSRGHALPSAGADANAAITQRMRLAAGLSGN